MKWLKYIVHPHTYIIFFILISVLALIPNGLSWRSDMLGYTSNYILLSIFFIFFYFLGYYLTPSSSAPQKRLVSSQMVNSFHFVYLICFFFFIIKFIYISGIPLINDSPYLRTRIGRLGGFVDFPTKAIALLGIVAYYFYITKKNLLCLYQLFISLILNILFAERSLIIFTLIGVLVLYLRFFEINIKTFRIIIASFFFILIIIAGVQIVRHGGKDGLDKSGNRTGLQVATWVIHGDLTGSQKLGAFVADRVEQKKFLYGRYTLGSYLAVFVPSFEEHGAEYIQKKFTKAWTAQSVAVPYSYYIDFGYFSLIFPFLIGAISRLIYLKFITLNSPFYTLLYPIYFFSLLWSVRAGNFPIEPKFIYYLLVLIFITSPEFKIKSNNQIIILLKLLFLLTLFVSFIALIIRW